MQGLDMKKNREAKCLYFKMANDLESGVYCLYLPNKNHPKIEPWNSPTLNPISILIYILVEAASHLIDTLLLRTKEILGREWGPPLRGGEGEYPGQR